MGMGTPEGAPRHQAECLICDEEQTATTFEGLPLCGPCAQVCENTLTGSYRYFEEQNGPLSQKVKTEFREQFAKQIIQMTLHGIECPCPECKHRRGLVWTKPEAAEGIRRYSQEARERTSDE